MRARPHLFSAVLAVIVTATAAGCGGDDEPRAARAADPVRLDLTAPADTAVVRAEVVAISGTVTPAGASVEVLGKPAPVSDGSFRTEVPLAPGANVIDVMATARGRTPAMTAIRVTREVPIEVPDLMRLELQEAQERAAEAGLELDIEQGGGLLEDILPGEPGVCDQDPAPGAEVRPGTTIDVIVAKSC